MLTNTVPTNPPTRPVPIGMKNGRLVYDPATWVEDALAVITWPDDKECFRVIAALVHAGLEGEIPRRECLRLAEKFVANGQGFTKYKPAEVQGLMKWIASKPCDRPATLGTIWWMAEQEGWKHTADYDVDLAWLHNEMATI